MPNTPPSTKPSKKKVAGNKHRQAKWTVQRKFEAEAMNTGSPVLPVEDFGMYDKNAVSSFSGIPYNDCAEFFYTHP